MAWLRLDDGFTEHTKVLALRRADRWTWLEVMTYCARQRNGGIFSEGICDVLRWVTPAFLKRCVEAGLLELVAGSQSVPGNHYAVHDWAIYNAGSIEERIVAFLDSNPSATANEVHRAIGGKRQVVLGIIQQIRDNDRFPGTTLAGSRSVPLTCARAPRPLTQPQQSKSDSSPSTEARPPARPDLPPLIDDPQHGEAEQFELARLLSEITASSDERVALRRWIDKQKFQGPYVFATARDELVQRRAKAPALKNEAGYVRRIIERYLSEKKEKPVRRAPSSEPEIE